MPKFVTIGYGDEAGYNRTAPDVRNAAHAHDRKLVERGALVGIAKTPTLVRNPAADLAEAVDMVAQSPCAVAHRVVEVWPLEQSKV